MKSRVAKSGILHIDHVHVAGWKQLDPHERRLFVRGLVCFHDNRNVINRYATLEKLRRAVDYIRAPLPFVAPRPSAALPASLRGA